MNKQASKYTSNVTTNNNIDVIHNANAVAGEPSLLFLLLKK